MRPPNSGLQSQTTTHSISIGPFTIDATADRLAYYPGDIVVVTVSVDAPNEQSEAAITGLDKVFTPPYF